MYFRNNDLCYYISMKEWLFYCIALGFAVGVFFSSFVDFGFTFAVFPVFIALILFGYFALEKGITNIPFFVACVIVVLAATGGGMIRYASVVETDRKLSLDVFDGKQVSAEGVVDEEPDVRDGKTKLTVLLQSLLSRGEKVEVQNIIIVSVPNYPEFAYGDTVIIEGKIQKPKNWPVKDGERSFDYVSYLAKDSVGYEIVWPKIVKVYSAEWSLRGALFDLKQMFTDSINRVIAEPQSSLLAGLLLGSRSSLGADYIEKFKRAGVVHIIALSGYNVTIVAETIMKFLSFLPRFVGLGAGAVSIVLFAVMTGGSATVVRASLMALVVVLARGTGRMYGLRRALVLAGLCMIIQNPRILVFDMSFELSFLAMVGLTFLSPFFERKLSWLTNRMKIREIVASTLATQVFVLPLLLYTSGLLSFVSIFANVLILPAIPLTMGIGFVTGFVGLFSPLVALPISYISYFLLSYILSVSSIAADLPFAAVSIPIFSPWLLVPIYAGLLLFVVWVERGREEISH